MATVVIVGRPNTGKSTLFNRLVGGRVAITLQQPGITRDRLIRDAEWRGRHFRVVDTGGLVPDSAEEIEREIGRQVAVALAEADAVVMVADGAVGLHPLDEEIALRLRRKSIRFLLAVNKRDVRRGFDTSEFHSLGPDRLFPVSAEHGTGLDDLLDHILTRLPPESRAPSPRPLSLAILGRPNTGKSTFLNSLLGTARAIVSPTPGTTRDAIEERFEFEGRPVAIVDTAGIRRHARVSEPVEYYSVSRALDQIQRCDVVLMVIAVHEGPTNQDKRIINLVEERNRGLVVVANKWDLVPHELRAKVQDYVKRELEFVDYAPVVYTVATKGRGVVEAVRQANAAYWSGDMRVSASFLRQTVLERLKSTQPAYDCRVLSISQVGTRPPSFRLRTTNPDSVTAAYRRFVINELRRSFGFTGYPVRLRVGR
jgi:GTP-binding protein